MCVQEPSFFNQPNPSPYAGPLATQAFKMAFRDLFFGGAMNIRSGAIHFIFPSGELRFGKPAAQAGDDFFRGNQFGEQGSVARGNFPDLISVNSPPGPRDQTLPKEKSLTAAA